MHTISLLNILFVVDAVKKVTFPISFPQEQHQKT